MTDALPRRRFGPPRLRARSSDPVACAASEFLGDVARKLGRGGNAEDQLRAPFEMLVKRIGGEFGLDPVPYGEVTLKELRARPDYAVDVGGARVGYIELKAPGRGIPPQWRPNKHERDQWEKLCALPNVIYTDGMTWGRYSYGQLVDPIVSLESGPAPPQARLDALDSAVRLLIQNFLLWKPDRPRSLADLIRIVARLCRLLRDEVTAIMTTAPDHAAYEDLTLLASDWRDLLFPDLSDTAFGDAYAQTIAFAMLLAQINGIALDDTPLHEIGRQLAKKHTLIGKAFSVLTGNDASDELSTIDTLRRVISAVDWTRLDDGHTNVYAELYEKFIAEYDPGLRRRSGSYYTPEPVARFMVGFVDEILRDRLERRWGFADEDVVVVDPAMGTGTFLVEIIQRVADTVDASQGEGARRDRLRELFQERLVGFERQVAPYAVAELRLHQALRVRFDTDIPARDVRFLTDTLENPREEQLRLAAPYRMLERSRHEANRIKRAVPVMVAIGNPPHAENAKGQAPWLEGEREFGVHSPPNPSHPSINDFHVPGAGRYESDLHGLQWYFWRWALWKVFDANPDHPAGAVALLTPESFTNARAFAGMREYLRRTCDEGWIIDLSPEGNRSKISTRIFGAEVQRRLCIAVFARYGPGHRDRPAVVHHLTLEGTREQKLDRLYVTGLSDTQWDACPDGWQNPFMPRHDLGWDDYPELANLMPWRSRGITTGRSWVYAPTADTLKRRWREFNSSGLDQRKILFHEGRDRKLGSQAKPLPGFPSASSPLATDHGDCPAPVRVAYRSFDRQWLIPDGRLMERPRPPLWAVRSDHQIYVSEQDAHPIGSGPGLTFAALIPDLHHFNGWGGGGVRPLFRAADDNTANVAPGLIRHLIRHLDICISAEDLLAYIAAVAAHPGYTARFRRELRQPGVRVPLTADPDVWADAVSVGRRVIWLQTFGERFEDPAAGRPRGALAIAEQSRIRNTLPIVSKPPGMPETLRYEARERTLFVGDGAIGPVERAVWDYDVGGMPVVRHWFDYRSKRPLHKKNKKGLDAINVTTWTPQLTNELLALLAVLTECVAAEPMQLDLLTRVCDGPLISSAELTQAGILPAVEWATKPPHLAHHTLEPLPDM